MSAVNTPNHSGLYTMDKYISENVCRKTFCVRKSNNEFPLLSM